MKQMISIFMMACLLLSCGRSEITIDRTKLIKNDVPGLSTALVDNMLRYIFYKGLIRGEYMDYFRYSHLDSIDGVKNNCCARVNFYVYVDCDGYKEAFLNWHPGADSKYFEKMQSCNAIQPAFINIINVKTPNGSWQGIDWEFSGIQVVMSDNLSNDPKLGVQLSYGLPNKVSSLNLDELDSLPVQKPFNRTSLDVKLTATTNGISGNEMTNGDLTVGSDGENLAFSPITLTANVGETVSLTFKNNSTALSHNFVLVNGGEDVATTVDEAASDAGEAAGYVPADNANIIASSALLAPGASATVEFTAPAAGTYTYICTYPAHFGGGMKGTLIVK